MFPFSIRDGETSGCSEIAILNLIKYFSVRAGQPSNGGCEVHFNFSANRSPFPLCHKGLCALCGVAWAEGEPTGKRLGGRRAVRGENPFHPERRHGRGKGG